ncbi:hypothetical protein NEOKW01_1625 [Nematocida sp. AWRm80]|nr:hypothetical protein NEOKW01_1625 [Nematocida sp. AWRm80]
MRNYTVERIPYELQKDRARAFLAPAAIRESGLKPGQHIRVECLGRKTVLKVVPKFDADSGVIYLPVEEMAWLGVRAGETVSFSKDSLESRPGEQINVLFSHIKKTVETLDTLRLILEDKRILHNGQIILGGKIVLNTEECLLTDQTEIKIVSERTISPERALVVGLETEREKLVRFISVAQTQQEHAPKGVLVTGPIGAGKTTMIEQALEEIGQEWVNIKPLTETALKESYAYSQLNQPCTLWIPRVDRLKEEKELQVFQKIEGVLEDIARNKERISLVCTAVDKSTLPKELLSARKLDTEIRIDLPGIDQRQEQIKKAHALHKQQTKNTCPIEVSALEPAAKRTAGFTRGELYVVLRDAFQFYDYHSQQPQKDLFKTTHHTEEEEEDKEDRYKQSITPESIGESIDQIHIGNQSGSIGDSRKIIQTRDKSNISLEADREERDKIDGKCEGKCLERLNKLIIRLVPSASNEKPLEMPDIRFSSVFGQSQAKDHLKQALVWPIQHKDLFKELDLTPPKGILLYGPPGCGKTLIAQAAANESGALFLSIRGPEIMGKYVGESEERLRKVFLRARSQTPAIIFIDEIDSIAPHRESEGSQVERRVVSTLLTEMDGVGTGADIFVIGATNKPWSIDSALMRPGRFDRHILIDLPDRETREQLLTSKLSKVFELVTKWTETEDISQSEHYSSISTESSTPNKTALLSQTIITSILQHTESFTPAELMGLIKEISLEVLRIKLTSPEKLKEIAQITAEILSKSHSRLSKTEVSKLREFQKNS